MILNELEIEVIRAMVRDAGSQEAEAQFDGRLLQEIDRSYSPKGFLVEILDRHEPALLGNVAANLGCDGLINGEEWAGFVGYVTNGRFDGLEGYTFSGNPWPERVVSFELKKSTK